MCDSIEEIEKKLEDIKNNFNGDLEKSIPHDIANEYIRLVIKKHKLQKQMNKLCY